MKYHAPIKLWELNLKVFRQREFILSSFEYSSFVQQSYDKNSFVPTRSEQGRFVSLINRIGTNGPWPSLFSARINLNANFDTARNCRAKVSSAVRSWNCWKRDEQAGARRFFLFRCIEFEFWNFQQIRPPKCCAAFLLWRGKVSSKKCEKVQFKSI